MWIIPAQCDVTTLWETLREDEHFVMQYCSSIAGQQPSLWSNLLGTLQAMFDVRQEPYRILFKAKRPILQPGDAALTIAVSASRHEAEAHWVWIEEHLRPSLDPLSPIDAAQMVCGRIEELVAESISGTDELADDSRFRATARSFRQLFNLPTTERLVNYYSCSMAGGGLGWLYLSEHYVAFNSLIMGVETKMILEISDIVDIQKERSRRTLLPDTICIRTLDGKEWRFHNLFHREETFDLLESLVNTAGHRMLRATDPQSPFSRAATESPVDTTTTTTAAAAARANKPTGSTLRETLSRQRQERLLQDIFRIPAGEGALLSLPCTVWTAEGEGEADLLEGPAAEGQLILTERLLLFSSSMTHQSIDRQRFSIPLCAISRVEKMYATLENSAEQPPPPEERDAYVLRLTTCHGIRINLSSAQGARKRDSLAFRLREALERNAELRARLLEPFLASLPSEQLVLGEEKTLRVSQGFGESFGYDLTSPSGDSSRDGYDGANESANQADALQLEQERQGILLQYWARYFALNGRNVGVIKTDLFCRLIRVGLPNRLRGELWEVCSGTLLARLFDGQATYSNLALRAAQSPKTTLAMEEIEKDLTRSLPEYSAYQRTEGIAKLRQVLTAYSLFDPELGYCQAMNIVVSVLLIFTDDEQAFWLLRYLCRQALPGYYSTSMWGAVLDQRVFELLLRRHLPSLERHLQAQQIQLSVVTLPWFLTIFLTTLPLKMALRVLDWFFLEGAVVLFQIALAIMQINEEGLLAVREEGQLVKLFKSYFATLEQPLPGGNDPNRPVSAFQYLLKTAYQGFHSTVTMEVVEALRSRHQLKVLQGIAAYTEKSTLRDVMDAHPDLRVSRDGLRFWYDKFAKAISRSGSNSIMALGVDFEGFLLFMSQSTTWPILSRRSAKPVGGRTSSAAGSMPPPSNDPLLVFLNFLFGRHGRERAGRILFREAVGLLEELKFGTLETMCQLLFECFAGADGLSNDSSTSLKLPGQAGSSPRPGLAYDGVVRIAELLLSLLEACQPEERDEMIAGISQLLKMAPIDGGLEATQFHTIIQGSYACQIFITGPLRETILAGAPPAKEDRGAPAEPGSASAHGIWSNLTGLWTPSPRTAPTRTLEEEREARASDLALEAAAQAVASISTPVINTLAVGGFEPVQSLLNDFGSGP